MTLKIAFVADVVCPFCWIGWARLKRTLAARPEVTPAVVWWPFQLDPTIPPEGKDRKAALAAKFPDAERLAEMQQRIVDMGAEDGLDFRFDAIERSPNTSMAHRLILWGQAEGKPEIVDRLFEAYFREGRNIGEPAVLAELACQVGLDGVAERLASDLDADAVQNAYAAAVKGGVTGVPFYVFQQKVVVTGAQDADMLQQAIDKALEA